LVLIERVMMCTPWETKIRTGLPGAFAPSV
jgi:hypothetical protein